jgi:hypothetical protein
VSIWRLVGGTLGIILLGLYATYHPADPQLFDLGSDLSAHVGMFVQLYVETSVKSVRPDGFRLRQGDATIWVRGVVPELAPGNYAAVEGVIQADGSLLPSRIETARPQPRWFRKWISVLALVVVAMALGRTLRLRRDGLEIRERA